MNEQMRQAMANAVFADKKHRHVAGTKGDIDVCDKCGLDLFNEVHERTEPQSRGKSVMIEDRILVREVTTYDPNLGIVTNKLERADIRIEFLGGERQPSSDPYTTTGPWKFVPKV